MPTAQAQVPTDRASRYLAQLCKHGSQMGVRALHQPRGHGDGGPPPKVRHAEWTDTEGIIDFGWGNCRMHASDERLVLLAEADDQHSCSGSRTASPDANVGRGGTFIRRFGPPQR